MCIFRQLLAFAFDLLETTTSEDFVCCTSHQASQSRSCFVSHTALCWKSGNSFSPHPTNNYLYFQALVYNKKEKMDVIKENTVMTRYKSIWYAYMIGRARPDRLFAPFLTRKNSSEKASWLFSRNRNRLLLATLARSVTTRLILLRALTGLPL